LKKAGFTDVETCADVHSARDILFSKTPDLIIVDIHLGPLSGDGINFISEIRSEGYAGLAAVISADFSVNQVVRAVRAGADEYFVKNEMSKFISAILNLLEKGRNVNLEDVAFARLPKLGYFSSFGLSPKEIDLLMEFAKSFSSFKEISEKTNISEGHIRKTFSNIYKKLKIDNIHQLSNIITICSFLGISR